MLHHRWIWISRGLFIVSLGCVLALIAALVWASRASLLYADALWLKRYQVIAWHEGLDFRLTICDYAPPEIEYKIDPESGERFIPYSDVLSGPYWRMDAVFEFSLWKALLLSLLYPCIQLLLVILRRRQRRRRGFEVIARGQR